MNSINIPLAERVRPQSLDQFIGQKKLLGDHGVIAKFINAGTLPSLIFWGPPGSGKTTLAHLLAAQFDLPFYVLSAVSAGVKQVRDVIQKAEQEGKSVLFIDEIHRFSKSQQDALLGAVEKGTITLIGATTENPSFEVISPLLSRAQVYILEGLGKDDLIKVVQRALEVDEFYKSRSVDVLEYEALLKYSGGDARKLLNLLELVVNSTASGPVKIDNEMVQSLVQQKMLIYDKSGEQHYDIISAFIKSIRGSDPNASLYYLARMIMAGEDPKFIARRLLILASEDIGNANPTALVLANNCFQAVTVIGYPECELVLSQTVLYLATSIKSNASYEALSKAKELVRNFGDLPVPLHLRNAPTKLMKEMNYGKAYKYAHSFPGNFVDQEFLPEAIIGSVFYEPGDNIREDEIRKRMRSLWGKKYNY